jgi:hypothetical protein
MCQLSDGLIEHVSPSEIPNTLDKMMALPILATNVQVRIIVYNALKIKNHNESCMTIDKNTVTEETNFTFAGVKKCKEDLKQLNLLNRIKRVDEIPFQY